MPNPVMIRTDYDVVQSLKFYYMLATYLRASGVSEYIATKSLNEFIREGETWHRKDSRVLNTYLKNAYNQLPSEFLSLLQISTSGDRDQISFKEKKLW
jgi:hypothetical protein